MDAPHRPEEMPNPPLWVRMAHAWASLDTTSKLAMLCVALGWFFMYSFVASLGALQHGVRFFEMSAVIADPSRLFFGGDAFWHRACFGLICIVCLAAPLAPHLVRARSAWLASFAPLGLMLTCLVILYWRTSGDLLAPPNDANGVAGSIVNFANDLARRGSTLVSRHLSLGAGSYWALIGGAVLGFQGVRRFRRHA